MALLFSQGLRAMGLERLLVPGGHSVGTLLKTMTTLPQNPPVDSSSAGKRDRPISPPWPMTDCWYCVDPLQATIAAVGALPSRQHFQPFSLSPAVFPEQYGAV